MGGSMELSLERIDRNGKAAVYLFLFCLLAITVIFRDAGTAMIQSWTQEEYSHGYLIPPLALLLLINRMIDSQLSPQGSWLGLGFVLLGVLAGSVFQMAGFISVLPQIYVLTLMGAVILFLGKRCLRPLAGPLLLILFATPLPKFFYYTISSQMQISSTSLGVFLLDAMGVTVFQEGNVIDLGRYQLNVVEACSGVRYLFPMLSLSFLLAYMFKAAWWKRGVVFFSTIPVSILLNGLRLALIGVTVNQWGSRMAEGFIHDFEGFVVFVSGVMILLLEIWVLRKIGVNGGELRFDGVRLPEWRKFPLPDVARSGQIGALLLGAVLLVSVTASLLVPHYQQAVPLRQTFEQFPMKIGEWSGRQTRIDPKELEVLGTDDYLLADYIKPGQPSISLYMLYYPQQDSTSNQAVHTPTVCIPSGGWSVQDTQQRVVPMDDPATTQSRPLIVNRLRISKGEVHQLVYYWYVQPGRSLTSSGATRAYTLINGLMTRHTNGGLVRLVTTIGKDENEDKAETRMMDFMKDSLVGVYGFIGITG